MDRSRDGDHASGDDGLIAQVIPLRRRGLEQTPNWDESAPAHSGVFDPPPEPEPLEEYSVWERPTAELVRRQPQPQRQVSLRGDRARLPRPPLWRVAIAVQALTIAAVAIALTIGSHTGRPQYAAHSGQSAQLGLGTVSGMGSVGKHAPPAPAHVSSTRARRRHRGVAATSRHGLAYTPPHSAEVSSATAPEVTVSVSAPTSTSSYSPPPASQQSSARAQAASAADREFGFER